MTPSTQDQLKQFKDILIREEQGYSNLPEIIRLVQAMERNEWDSFLDSFKTIFLNTKNHRFPYRIKTDYSFHTETVPEKQMALTYNVFMTVIRNKKELILVLEWTISYAKKDVEVGACIIKIPPNLKELVEKSVKWS